MPQCGTVGVNSTRTWLSFTRIWDAETTRSSSRLFGCSGSEIERIRSIEMSTMNNLFLKAPTKYFILVYRLDFICSILGLCGFIYPKRVRRKIRFSSNWFGWWKYCRIGIEYFPRHRSKRAQKERDGSTLVPVLSRKLRKRHVTGHTSCVASLFIISRVLTSSSISSITCAVVTSRIQVEIECHQRCEQPLAWHICWNLSLESGSVPMILLLTQRRPPQRELPVAQNGPMAQQLHLNLLCRRKDLSRTCRMQLRFAVHVLPLNLDVYSYYLLLSSKVASLKKVKTKSASKPSSKPVSISKAKQPAENDAIASSNGLVLSIIQISCFSYQSSAISIPPFSSCTFCPILSWNILPKKGWWRKHSLFRSLPSDVLTLVSGRLQTSKFHTPKALLLPSYNISKLQGHISGSWMLFPCAFSPSFVALLTR